MAKKETNVDEFLSEEKENTFDFFKGLNRNDMKKSAQMNVLPKIQIDDVGVGLAKVMTVLSAPYQIKIPMKKYMGKGDNPILSVIDVEYKGVKHQFIVEAASFKYQYGTVMEQLGFDLDHPELMIGAIIKVWLEEVELEKWGKSKLYKIQLISKPPK